MSCRNYNCSYGNYISGGLSLIIFKQGDFESLQVFFRRSGKTHSHERKLTLVAGAFDNIQLSAVIDPAAEVGTYSGNGQRSFFKLKENKIAFRVISANL